MAWAITLSFCFPLLLKNRLNESWKIRLRISTVGATQGTDTWLYARRVERSTFSLDMLLRYMWVICEGEMAGIAKTK